MSEKKYYILVDKSPVEVTKEVYKAYKRPAWRERKRRIVRQHMELSLNLYLEDGFDIPEKLPYIDEIAEDELYDALSELTDDERSLIKSLFFAGNTECEIASMGKVSQQAVNKRKKRILAKLKEMLLSKK